MFYKVCVGFVFTSLFFVHSAGVHWWSLAAQGQWSYCTCIFNCEAAGECHGDSS